MSSARDQVIAALADDIMHGCTPGRIALATVIDVVLDEPLVSNEDAAMLLFGDAESKLNTQERCEKAAQAVVAAWLLSSPRGIALVDREVEKRAEEEAA